MAAPIVAGKYSRQDKARSLAISSMETKLIAVARIRSIDMADIAQFGDGLISEQELSMVSRDGNSLANILGYRMLPDFLHMTVSGKRKRLVYQISSPNTRDSFYSDGSFAAISQKNAIVDDIYGDDYSNTGVGLDARAKDLIEHLAFQQIPFLEEGLSIYTESILARASRTISFLTFKQGLLSLGSDQASRLFEMTLGDLLAFSTAATLVDESTTLSRLCQAVASALYTALFAFVIDPVTAKSLLTDANSDHLQKPLGEIIKGMADKYEAVNDKITSLAL